LYIIYIVFGVIHGTIGIERGFTMGMITYNKLFEVMKEKNINTSYLRKNKIISESTLHNIRHGRGITTDAIGRLCKALNCQPGDILEYKPDDNTNT
jgi:putative transcriptional regulator